MAGIGRTLLIAGLVLAAFGLLLILGDKLPFRIGRLPGDIIFKGKNTTFYFPLMTCIILSVLLSLVMYLIGKR
ncbi:MAG: DUF2905 domain-containing protein [Acidobacteria bacterium]|nr:DUF2905 domain-containing protein [Acidobacteriota bacterium]